MNRVVGLAPRPQNAAGRDVVGILPVKFEHSIERSAEYLRMALPLMSRQLSALHPVSYALWR